MKVLVWFSSKIALNYLDFQLSTTQTIRRIFQPQRTLFITGQYPFSIDQSFISWFHICGVCDRVLAYQFALIRVPKIYWYNQLVFVILTESCKHYPATCCTLCFPEYNQFLICFWFWLNRDWSLADLNCSFLNTTSLIICFCFSTESVFAVWPALNMPLFGSRDLDFAHVFRCQGNRYIPNATSPFICF